MTKYVGLVEDNRGWNRKYADAIGKDHVLSAMSVEEFEEKLLPRKDEIVVWVLDVNIPRKKDWDTEARNGIEVARVLHRECPDVPKFCISGTDEWESIRNIYTQKLEKQDVEKNAAIINGAWQAARESNTD